MSDLAFDDIRKLVEIQFGKRNIREDDRLVEDLGAESADIGNLVALVEEKFQIMIKEAEIARIFTPLDLYELIRQRQHES